MIAIGKRNGIYVKCEACGKEIYKTQYQFNKYKHHYCSNKCQSNKKRDETYEYRDCEICGSKMYVRKLSTQRFCSDSCQNEWQKTRVGFDNPKFEGGRVTCDWCGKEYVIGKYKLNNENHFCSNECRRGWYSNVWSQREEWKDESKKRAVKLLSDRKKENITMTKPQIAINNLLDKLNISYRNEESFVYYSIDNYLTDYSLAIEVMGDYWHCSPMRYKEIKNNTQKHIISRDKAKRSFLRSNYNINILYLWEKDICERIDLCERLILSYIDNHGILENYNSFNYSLENGKLKLNKELIKPFQEVEKIAS